MEATSNSVRRHRQATIKVLVADPQRMVGEALGIVLDHYADIKVLTDHPTSGAEILHRTENIRPISPTEPAFKKLFGRRNDSEAINRDLVDSMWLGSAHSLGHARQHLNLIGYAVMVNALALHQHRKRREKMAAA